MTSNNLESTLETIKNSYEFLLLSSCLNAKYATVLNTKPRNIRIAFKCRSTKFISLPIGDL